VFFQTLHGVAAGVEVCVLARCDDVRPIVTSLALGAGAGLAASLYASREGVTYGQAGLVNAGSAYGFWHGLALALMTGTEDPQGVAGAALAGQLAGTGVGALLWEPLDHPDFDDVAFVGAAALGITYLSASVVLGDRESSDTTRWLGILLTTDAATLAGGYVASEMPMRWGRSMITASGAVVGGLVGMGVDVIVQGDEVRPAPLWTLTAMGALGGIAAATYLTQEWDSEDVVALPLLLAPTDGGAVATAALAW